MLKSVRDILKAAWVQDPPWCPKEFLSFIPTVHLISDAVRVYCGPEPSRLFSPPSLPPRLEIEDKMNSRALTQLDAFPDKLPSRPHSTRLVQQSALSANGLLVALSYQNGDLEVVYSDSGERAWLLASELCWKGQRLPPLVWLEFVQGDSRVIGEDEAGCLWLIDQKDVVDVRAPLPYPGLRCFAGISSWSRLVRASFESPLASWPHNLVLIELLKDAIILRPLAPPQPDAHSSSQLQPRSLGFSPDGTRVGAFDNQEAHIWSTITAAHIASYKISRHSDWTLNLCSTYSDSSGIHPSFYPPLPNSANPAGTDVSQLSGEINVASAVFIEIPRRPITPKSLYPYKYLSVWPSGTVGYNDRSPFALPPELKPLGSHRLRYVIDDTHIRMLVGGQAIATSGYGNVKEGAGDERVSAGDVLYVPPIVIDLLLAQLDPRP